MAPKKVAKKVDLAAQTAVQSVTGMDQNVVVQELGQLQVRVQQEFAELQATLTNKLGDVKLVDLAIDEKKKQLQELYGIEAEAAKLEDVKAQRESEEVAADQARQDRETARKEEDSNRAKAVEREQEEYVYNIKKRNDRALVEFETLVEGHKRTEKIRQETLEREWRAREDLLKAQEADVAKMKEQAATFDARVKAEADKAVAIATNSLKRDYTQAQALAAKDIEAAGKLHVAEMNSKDATIVNLNAQIAALTTQLAEARKDAKDVVQKTLDAQSKGEAFAALQKSMEVNAAGGSKK